MIGARLFRAHTMLAAIALLTAITACARHCRPLTAVTLHSPDPIPGVAIRIDPLHDARGDLFEQWSPVGRLPLVSLLYQDTTTCYPLATGCLRNQTALPAYTLIGHLPSDFPGLLRRMLQPGTLTDGPPAYTINGTLHQTCLRQRDNVVPLRLLALLGLPYRRIDVTLTIAITLTREPDRAAPLLARTYSRSDHCTSGYYRNHSAAHQLYVDTLRALLNDMASDIARLITRDRTT